jgi:disulfide oxidoreductase YuzD
LNDFLTELSLLKKNFSFRSLTFVWMYVYGSDCMCRFVIRMRRSSSNLVMVHWFLTELSLLKKKFSFRSLTFVWMYVYGSDCMCRFVIRMRRSSSNLVMVHWFLTELSLLNLQKKIEILSFRSLIFVWMHVQDSNCMCRFVVGMCRSSSNLVMVHWFWQSYPSWNYNKKKYMKFSVSIL